LILNIRRKAHEKTMRMIDIKINYINTKSIQ
jgi:hypothetical protein